MDVLGSGAAVLDLLFQINSYRSILFDFGTDVSTWTFELYLKKNKGDRLKTLSLTLGSGLSFPVYASDQVQAVFSTTNTNIQEGQYYYELRRTDVAVPLVNGFAYFSFDAPQGTSSSSTLSLTVSSQTISLTISSIQAGSWINTGNHDASTGVFPTGTYTAFNTKKVNVAGIIDSVYCPAGSILIAMRNTPTSNWDVLTGWKLI